MALNKKQLIGAGVAAFLVVGYVGASYVIESNAKRVVENNIARFRTQMETAGWTTVVTYETLEAKKLSLHPQIRLLKVKTSLSRANTLVETNIPEIRYIPKSFTMQNYEIQMQGNMNVKVKDQQQREQETLVQFSTSPVMNVSLEVEGKRHYSLHVPQKISLIPQLKEDEMRDARSFEMVMGAEPTASWVENNDGGIDSQKFSAKDMHFLLDNTALASIGALESETNRTIEENGSQHIKTSFNVSKFELMTENGKAWSPINLKAANRYDISTADETTHQSLTQPNTSLYVDQFEFTSALTNANIKGEVHAKPDTEKMPYGKLELHFEHLDKAFGYAEEQNPERKEFFAHTKELVSRISGTPVDSDAAQDIIIERAEKGHVKVGKLSFEEAFAGVLGLAMQNAQSKPQSMAPKAEEAPKTTDENDQAPVATPAPVAPVESAPLPAENKPKE